MPGNFLLGNVNSEAVSKSFIQWFSAVPASDPLQTLSLKNQPFKRKSCDDTEKMVSDCIRVHGGKPGDNGSGCFSGVCPGF